jgi:hypothetical protein
MNVRYLEPLSAAYRRMKSALFRPFNLDKWLVVGFASWISGWGAHGGGNYNFRVPKNWMQDQDSGTSDGLQPLFEQMGTIWADPMWRALIITGLVVLFALGIVILWINSRGAFVFLDCVLNERRAIAVPWRTYRAEGNSLFVWQLVFSLIGMAAFLSMLGIVLFLACGGRLPHSLEDVPWIRFGIGLVVTWLPFAFVAIYVQHFLHHFVTPIMFRDRVTTTEAWRTFLPLLGERLGTFVLYGLFYLAVQIGLFLAMIPAICLTCCLLGCLLIIPYVGAVVWLPVSYGCRALGPEFLAQFGPGFNVWPVPAVVPVVTPDGNAEPEPTEGG